MIIADLDHIEEATESSNLVGGRRRRRRNQNNGFASLLPSLFQSLSIYPASSAAINTLGGDAIGNTAISFNISMPILIAVNGSNGSILGILNPLKSFF